MSDNFHPTDGYSRAAAIPATARELTENFEHARDCGQSDTYKMGSFEVIASVAIARVQLLEELLSERREAAFSSAAHDNVVPIHKYAPAPSTSRPGA